MTVQHRQDGVLPLCRPFHFVLPHFIVPQKLFDSMSSVSRRISRILPSTSPPYGCFLTSSEGPPVFSLPSGCVSDKIRVGRCRGSLSACSVVPELMRSAAKGGRDWAQCVWVVFQS